MKRRRRDGTLYERPAKIEASIDAAHPLALQELVRRANLPKITVEGVIAVNASTSSTTPFVSSTVTVNVTDGRLTLGSDYNGWANTRLAFVDVASVDAVPAGTGVQQQVTFGIEARTAIAGYFNDFGQPFGLRRNGETFGWLDTSGGTATSVVGAGFGHGGSSDQRKVQSIVTGGKTWEMVVPNGDYWLKLVAGDPDYQSGTYGYDVEGTAFLRGTAGTDAARWITAEQPIHVSDGRLTIKLRRAWTMTR